MSKVHQQGALGPARGDGSAGSRSSAVRGGESIGNRKEGGRKNFACLSL